LAITMASLHLAYLMLVRPPEVVMVTFGLIWAILFVIAMLSAFCRR
jgi:hypothetical protein